MSKDEKKSASKTPESYREHLESWESKEEKKSAKKAEPKKEEKEVSAHPKFDKFKQTGA